MRTLRTLAFLALVAAPLAAQHRNGMVYRSDMRRVRPKSCPLADSLAGRPLPRPERSALGWVNGDTRNVVSNDVFAITATRPLDAFMLTGTTQVHGADPDPVFALQIRMRDQSLRQGSGAVITLTVDDSISVPIGEMFVTPTGADARGLVDQVLVKALTGTQARILATATKISGTLGSLTFTVPPRTIQTFGSVYLTLVCGARI